MPTQELQITFSQPLNAFIAQMNASCLKRICYQNGIALSGKLIIRKGEAIGMTVRLQYPEPKHLSNLQLALQSINNR